MDFKNPNPYATGEFAQANPLRRWLSPDSYMRAELLPPPGVSLDNPPDPTGEEIQSMNILMPQGGPSWMGESQSFEGYPQDAGGYQDTANMQIPSAMDARAGEMYASVQENPVDQYMTMGRQMAQEMANDTGALDQAYELSVAARTGRNVGEVLNEQKARRINAMNALTAQVNSEIAYMNAMKEKQGAIPSSIQEALFAAGGDSEAAQELMRGTFKERGQKTGTQLMQEAGYLFPGDENAQREWIMAQRAKKGGGIDIRVGGDSGDFEMIELDKTKGIGYFYNRETGEITAQKLEGGPAAEADINRTGTKQKYADVVSSSVQKLLEMNKDGKISGWGSIFKDIPESAAKDASGIISALKSAISFERLQEMREASPTGGALGQVSNFENERLESALGSLEQSQSAKALNDNLRYVRKVYLDIIHGEGNWKINSDGSLSLKGVDNGSSTRDFSVMTNEQLQSLNSELDNMDDADVEALDAEIQNRVDQGMWAEGE
jgi:hypothetical protein